MPSLSKNSKNIITAGIKYTSIRLPDLAIPFPNSEELVKLGCDAALCVVAKHYYIMLGIEIDISFQTTVLAFPYEFGICVWVCVSKNGLISCSVVT